MDFFEKYYDRLHHRLKQSSVSDLESVVDLIRRVSDRGGKVVIAGNGGSASISSHVSIDLTKAAGIRAICFNEANLLTCFGNDYGYENWLKEALRFYTDSDDLVILISSSGKSANIVNAANFVVAQGLDLVTLSGFDVENPLRKLGKVNLFCDDDSYNIVESCHQTWLLAIIDRCIDLKTSSF